jgi:hypothetical protein
MRVMGRFGVVPLVLIVSALSACGGGGKSGYQAELKTCETHLSNFWSPPGGWNAQDCAAQGYSNYFTNVVQPTMNQHFSGATTTVPGASTPVGQGHTVRIKDPYSGYTYELTGAPLIASHTYPGSGAPTTPNGDVVYMPLTVTNTSGQSAPAYSFESRLSGINNTLPQCSGDIAALPTNCQGGIGEGVEVLDSQGQMGGDLSLQVDAGATYTMYLLLGVARGATTDGIRFYVTDDNGKPKQLSP